MRLDTPYLAAAVVYAIGIYVLSAMPDPPGPEPAFPGMDKVVHAVVYFGFAALLHLGFHRSNPNASRRRLYWVPFCIAAAYGLSDEIHQIYVPNRAFDILDLAADAAGAFVAQVCYRVLRFPGVAADRESPVDGEPDRDGTDHR